MSRTEGYQELVTQLFRPDDPYLVSDAVFGAKRGLIAHAVDHDAGDTAPDGTVLDEPFVTVEWTFILTPDSAK